MSLGAAATAEPITAAGLLARQNRQTVGVVDGLGQVLTPGRVVELAGPEGSGATSLGLALLAGYPTPLPVVVVDPAGRISPLAAAEAGLPLERLVVVRCQPAQWVGVIAALTDGIPAVLAEVPDGIPESQLRRLAAAVRSRRCALALRAVRPLPPGVAFTRLHTANPSWSGTADGHGHLERRHVEVHLAGKAMPATARSVAL